MKLCLLSAQSEKTLTDNVVGKGVTLAEIPKFGVTDQHSEGRALEFFT